MRRIGSGTKAAGGLVKTALLLVMAAILFLGLFRVEITAVKKSPVEKRAEALTDSESVEAMSKFVARDNAAYFWAESEMTSDCYRQATAGSIVPDAQILADCEGAIHERAPEFPYLSIKVSSRLERSR
jgi:hypothetical protein